jgi:hypothetical protein
MDLDIRACGSGIPGVIIRSDAQLMVAIRPGRFATTSSLIPKISYLRGRPDLQFIAAHKAQQTTDIVLRYLTKGCVGFSPIFRGLSEMTEAWS